MRDLTKKYRPGDWINIVGQESLVKVLQKEIETNTVGHAYLFTGPRGTGKTTTARVFADNLDAQIVELDAASNNGVDNIRDIKTDVLYMPADGKKRKVYIIDEVHMLTTGAFNAFLKTLEEPPAHVIFILATTDPQKIPVTILSRCQRFDLVSIGTEDIVQRLGYICEQEKINLGENGLDTLTYIAEAVDGGMRDAIKLLQKCTALADLITVQTVVEALGNVDKDAIKRVLEYVLNKDRLSVLKEVRSMLSAGIDAKVLVANMIEFSINKVTDLLQVEEPPQEVLTLLINTSDFLIDLSNEIKFSNQAKQVTMIRLISRATPATSGVNIDYSLDSLQGQLPDQAIMVLKGILNAQEQNILARWA